MHAQHLIKKRCKVGVLRLYIMAIGGISIVLALVLSAWLSAKLSRPVRELRDVAEQFGAGRLEKRVGIHSGDELGQLAQSFNMMADNLDFAYRELSRFPDARYNCRKRSAGG